MTEFLFTFLPVLHNPPASLLSLSCLKLCSSSYSLSLFNCLTIFFVTLKVSILLAHSFNHFLFVCFSASSQALSVFSLSWSCPSHCESLGGVFLISLFRLLEIPISSFYYSQKTFQQKPYQHKEVKGQGKLYNCIS